VMTAYRPRRSNPFGSKRRECWFFVMFSQAVLKKGESPLGGLRRRAAGTHFRQALAQAAHARPARIPYHAGRQKIPNPARSSTMGSEVKVFSQLLPPQLRGTPANWQR
jgi:hypothetical protein